VRVEQEQQTMNYKQWGLGLGAFSIALGITEVFAARPIARALNAEGHQGVIKAFGAREIAAGVALLQAPAHAARVWNRVAGDGLDLGALALAARGAPRNKAIWGAIAFVVGATVLDAVVARGLDRTTGKTPPTRQPGDSLTAAAA
jgi:hypothetical protein